MTRIAFLSALVFLAGTASAAEPSLRDLLPDNRIATVELRSPGRALRHPLVRSTWDELSHSQELQRRIEAPEFDKLAQVKQFFAQLAEPEAGWTVGFDRLTSGGVVLGLGGQPGSHEVFVATATEGEATAKRFLEVLQSTILQRLPAEQRPPAFPTETRRGVEVLHLGEAWIANVGKVLLATNRADALDRALDRLKTWENVSLAPGSSDALLSLDLDLAQIRKLPDVEKGLALPSDDIGRVFVLGGWIDLLRRAERLRLDVTPDETGFATSLRFSAGRDGTTPGLAGFFATGVSAESKGVAAPLLRVPGMIYSGSVYRDYLALWQGRQQTLDAAALKRFDDGTAQTRKQLEVFGALFPPEAFVADLGTHFRLVVARQQRSAYRLDLPEKLPAAAFVVDWRRDSFRDKLQPILRFFSLIAGADNNQGTTVIEKHADAELSSIRFREDAIAVARGNRIRFQFSPTYTFTRGHFIAGSTTEIVRQTIDALDAEARDAATRNATAGSGGAVTEHQWFSNEAAAEALGQFRSMLLNASALGNGLTLSEAEHELDVAQRVLRSLGEARSTSTFGEKHFEIRLRVGPASGRPE